VLVMNKESFRSMIFCAVLDVGCDFGDLIVI
jgi:hypothetical protein